MGPNAGYDRDGMECTTMTDVEACLAAAIKTCQIALDAGNVFATEELAMAAERLFDRAWSLNEADDRAPPLDPDTWQSCSNWKQSNRARVADYRNA